MKTQVVLTLLTDANLKTLFIFCDDAILLHNFEF